jgi:hypothetical protein
VARYPAGVLPAGTQRGARRRLLLALAVAAATVGSAVPSLAAGEGAAGTSSAERLQPPLSSRIDVPLREAVGVRAARAAPAGAGGVGEPEPPPSKGEVLPVNRVVSVYGAPQLGATIVGRKSPEEATGKAVRLARRYEAADDARPGLPALDLIATVATRDPGSDGKYRTRQLPSLIDTYLEAARDHGARLMLDIQPGRSSFRREVRALSPWLREPDVDIALDPEWNVGRRGVPGQSVGRVGPRQVNRVSELMARIVRENDLPPKLLVIHQFREDSVRKEDRVVQRPGNVSVVLNFDGIGSPSAKAAGYRALIDPDLYNGFSVFVRLDSDVMSPDEVVALRPPPDFLLYQ